MKASISDIRTSAAPDLPRVVKFHVQVHGFVDFAIIDYGDGTEERTDIPTDEPHPLLLSEHRFAPGRYRVNVSIYYRAVLQERRPLAVSVQA